MRRPPARRTCSRVLLSAAAALVACLAMATAAAAAEFRSVDVLVDAGPVPLAGYQLEIIADGARIVGVEGGEHEAFAEPPRYDPAALQGGRIILAAFDLGGSLPIGRTRVATLHLLEDAAEPTYRATLIVAGDADGHSIPARVDLIRRGESQ